MSFGIPVRNGLGVGLLASTSLSTRNRAGFSPASLFAAGEQGGWYDPSDLSTLFQDSAGTTPVTTPGQSVGLMLDKSGRGNHATQSNAAQRPTYGIVPAVGRRNQITFTEQLDNAIWTLARGGTVSTPVRTPNFATAPDGTTTATRLQITAGAATTASDFGLLRQVVNVPASSQFNSSIWLRSNTGANQSVTLRYNEGASAVVTVTSVWQRLAANGANGAPSFDVGVRGDTLANSNVDILLWQPQAETGSTATAYQRVGTAFDVTEAGVASMSYVSFDGTDDGMLTGNIVPGTDKAQVFAGVRKLSDAAVGEVVGLSASPGGLAGTFFLRAPNSASASYQYRSRGTTANGVIYTNALVAAPVTNVLTGLSDISGPSEALRVNGAVVGSNTLTQGTGNYLTYPLYIGRTGSTSNPFNGQIFGLIVRFGTNLPASTISQTETWLGARVAPTVVIP
jgi:hypothetical protein